MAALFPQCQAARRRPCGKGPSHRAMLHECEGPARPCLIQTKRSQIHTNRYKAPQAMSITRALWASKPLRPRCSFDLETIGLQIPKSSDFWKSNPKTVLRSKPPRGHKKGPGGETTHLCCTSLRGGTTKRTALSPLWRAVPWFRRYTAPAGRENYASVTPFGRGNASKSCRVLCLF